MKSANQKVSSFLSAVFQKACRNFDILVFSPACELDPVKALDTDDWVFLSIELN